MNRYLDKNTNYEDTGSFFSIRAYVWSLNYNNNDSSMVCR